MKNLTLLIALFLSLTLAAQDHPGKRPEMLLGKEVTIKELPLEKQARGYNWFYQDKDLLKTYEDNGMFTKYDALVNKTFTVVSVEPGVNALGRPNHGIKLQAADGSVVYFSYVYYYDYYFRVKGGLEYPADFYCDYITEASHISGYAIETYPDFILYKSKLEEIPKYTLYASTQQKEIDLSAGVTLTLENGVKIIKPNVEPKVTPLKDVNGYEHSVMIPLTNKDLEQLKLHKITTVQIGKFKETPRRSEEVKNALPCLMTK